MHAYSTCWFSKFLFNQLVGRHSRRCWMAWHVMPAHASPVCSNGATQWILLIQDLFSYSLNIVSISSILSSVTSPTCCSSPNFFLYTLVVLASLVPPFGAVVPTVAGVVCWCSRGFRHGWYYGATPSLPRLFTASTLLLHRDLQVILLLLSLLCFCILY